MQPQANYWITIAHLPGWGYRKVNALIKKIVTEEKISVEEFFKLSESALRSRYRFALTEISDLAKVRQEMENTTIIAEKLATENCEIIPIISPDYSPILLKNLSVDLAPPVLYTIGDKKMLQSDSIAIVGSRTAAEPSLAWTDNISKLACKQGKVIVSGYAKGVDQQALSSALRHQGKSIIVLPQGIATFGKEIKKYSKQIDNGQLLVLSCFRPNAAWAKGLAIARNAIIYGLANQVFIAETGNDGGTWSGAINGMKKGRLVYIRNPQTGEVNANKLLIRNGAIAVDENGAVLR